jgi:hypothetical protein
VQAHRVQDKKWIGSMGGVNKKNRQLRRKIRDLQGELRSAEADGNYVVEEGIYFAGLEEMGDMTMMVFGSTESHASHEDEVIRTFMDRNGFTVEELKLDKTGRNLEAVKIVPPMELLMWMGKQIQKAGFRIIDDGDAERKPDLERKIFPISTLARVCAILFVEKVGSIIKSTQVKMNKEGNRLLSWMPLVVERMQEKVLFDVIDVTHPYFELAFDRFYAQTGKVKAPPQPDKPLQDTKVGFDGSWNRVFRFAMTGPWNLSC